MSCFQINRSPRRKNKCHFFNTGLSFSNLFFLKKKYLPSFPPHLTQEKERNWQYNFCVEKEKNAVIPFHLGWVESSPHSKHHRRRDHHMHQRAMVNTVIARWNWIHSSTSYRGHLNIPFPSTSSWPGLGLAQVFFPEVHGFHPATALSPREVRILHSLDHARVVKFPTSSRM